MKTTRITVTPRRSSLPVSLHIRPSTTDEKVVEEVLRRGAYEKPRLGFLIEPGDRWLDLGANIGTFVLLCMVRGVESVTAYEPEPENLGLLQENIRSNARQFPGTNVRVEEAAVGVRAGTMPLFLCGGEYNKYRHSLVLRKRGGRKIDVPVLAFREVVRDIGYNGSSGSSGSSGSDCIKMDIEGAEIEILETMKPSWLKKIRKLVFEYSFDVDASIPRFMKIIEKLRGIFPNVKFDKVKTNDAEYRFFPMCTMVYCWK